MANLYNGPIGAYPDYGMGAPDEEQRFSFDPLQPPYTIGQAPQQYEPITAESLSGLSSVGAPAMPKPEGMWDKLGRGTERLGTALQATVTAPLGIGREGLAASIAEEAAAEQARFVPESEREWQQRIAQESKEFEEAEGFVPSLKEFGDVAGAAVSDLGALGGAFVENIPYSLPSIAGSIGGAVAGAKVGAGIGTAGGPLGAAVGGALGALVGGFATEFGAKYVEEAREEAGKRGLDPTDPQAVASVISDERFNEEAMPAAAKKGGGIAAVDAAFMLAGAGFGSRAVRNLNSSIAAAATQHGIDLATDAGRRTATRYAPFLTSIKPAVEAYREATGLGRTTLRTMGVLGAETVGEGAGEALGQYWADGEIDAGDVVLESILGGATSVAQTGVATGIGRMRSEQPDIVSNYEDLLSAANQDIENLSRKFKERQVTDMGGIPEAPGEPGGMAGMGAPGVIGVPGGVGAPAVFPEEAQPEAGVPVEEEVSAAQAPTPEAPRPERARKKAGQYAKESRIGENVHQKWKGLTSREDRRKLFERAGIKSTRALGQSWPLLPGGVRDKLVRYFEQNPEELPDAEEIRGDQEIVPETRQAIEEGEAARRDDRKLPSKEGRQVADEATPEEGVVPEGVSETPEADAAAAPTAPAVPEGAPEAEVGAEEEAAAEGEREWVESDIQDNPQLTDAAFVERIKNYAAKAGWQERAGKLIRNEAGEVTGRTVNVPNEPWWLEKPKNVTEAVVRSMVTKLDSGKKLNKKERDALAFLTNLANGKVEGFELEAQTPEDLAAQEAERRVNEEVALAQERMRKAEEEQGEFVLTATDRPADELRARGQQEIDLGTSVVESKRIGPQDELPFARRQAPVEGSTVDEVRSQISKAYGKRRVRVLERAGRLNIVQSQDDLPTEIQPAGGDIVAGAYADGTIYLVADNLDNLDNALAQAIFAHESTHRSEIRDQGLLTTVLGRRANGVMEQLNELAATGDTAVIDAFNAVPTDTPQNLIDSERIAYFVQGAVERLASQPQTLSRRARNVLRNIVESVKAWFATTEIGQRFRFELTDEFVGALVRRSIRQPEGEDAVEAYAFLGEKAQTADRFALGAAKQAIDGGADPETVRQQTGWFKGPDEKWRFEINDEDAKLRYQPGPDLSEQEAQISAEAWEDGPAKEFMGRLGEILDHPRLFAAYPGLTDLEANVFVYPDEDAVSGSFDGRLLTVRAPSEEEALSSVLHEVQHSIQDIEGFARGGTPALFEKTSMFSDEFAREMTRGDAKDLIDKAKTARKQGDLKKALELTDQASQSASYEAYRRLYGEVEARNVQTRQYMPDEYRLAFEPWRTESVPQEEAIVTFNGRDALNAPQPANAVETPSERELPVEDTSVGTDVAAQTQQANAQYSMGRVSGGLGRTINAGIGRAKRTLHQIEDISPRNAQILKNVRRQKGETKVDTIRENASIWLKRNFASGGNLPKQVMEAWTQDLSSQSSIQVEVDQILAALDRAVLSEAKVKGRFKTFADAPAEVRENIMRAVAGNQESLMWLGDNGYGETAKIAGALREKIDNLSFRMALQFKETADEMTARAAVIPDQTLRERAQEEARRKTNVANTLLINAGVSEDRVLGYKNEDGLFIDPNTQEVLPDQTKPIKATGPIEQFRDKDGRYYNSSYAAFNEKNWHERVPAEAMDDAADMFRRRLNEKADRLEARADELQEQAARLDDPESQEGQDLQARADAARYHAQDIRKNIDNHVTNAINDAITSGSRYGSLYEYASGTDMAGEMDMSILMQKLLAQKPWWEQEARLDAITEDVSTILDQQDQMDPGQLLKSFYDIEKKTAEYRDIRDNLTLRALLGEYRDPRINITSTLSKQGEMAFHYAFLNRIARIGRGDFLWVDEDPDIPGGDLVVIGEGKAFGPLNGMKARREVAQAFEDILDRENLSGIYRNMVQAAGLVKYGKTILSPTTQLRNFMSAAFFSIANTHFNPREVGQAFKVLRAYAGKQTEFGELLERMGQLGITFDSANIGEIRSTIKDVEFERFLGGKALLKVKKANDFALNMYQFGDDFWKLIGFQVEQRILEKYIGKRVRNKYADPGWKLRSDIDVRETARGLERRLSKDVLQAEGRDYLTLDDNVIGRVYIRPTESSRAGDIKYGLYTEQGVMLDDSIFNTEQEARDASPEILAKYEIERRAANSIRDTYPTYSLVPRAIKKLRRWPLHGSFVSFPAEIVRTTKNQFKRVYDEYQDEVTKPLAYRRAAGMMLASAWVYALQEALMAMWDVGDDEEEAIRLLAADWNANSNLAPAYRGSDGKLSYFDLSFMDPYNYLKRPINAMLRDRPVDESITDALWEILAPFAETDILAGSLLEVYENEKESGGKVFNEEDTTGNQTADIAQHLLQRNQPGLTANIERLAKAMAGTKKATGEPYSVGEELAANLGFRLSSLNPKTALKYRSFEFADATREAKRILNATLRDPNVLSEADLRGAYDRASSARERAYRDMSKISAAAMRAGLSWRQTLSALRSAGISRTDANAIMRGEVPRWNISMSTVRRSIRQARTFDEDLAQQMRERYYTIGQFAL